ncbi:LysR family transcriptional regulator [Variovorax sp. KBW07]|nr:LysR family transcriptional regulator [Variovorax sp. KBW07]
MTMATRSRDPLDLVSLRQLRYFSAAMRARSFNEAARSCSISQSALSDQIALLENLLEVHLFDRTGGRAVPTAPGRELDRRISACLGDLQSALLHTNERADTVAGRVRIGLVQSYSGCWVAPVAHAAQAQWPELSLVLQRRTAQALTEGVLRGDLDMAVSFDPEPHADLDIEPCFIEPFVAVGAMAGVARQRGKSIALASLADARLALLPSEYTMRRQLDAAFAKLGLRPQVGLESDVLEDLVHAADCSGMVAILNAAAALSLDVKNAMPLKTPGLQRQACLVRSRTRFQTSAAKHLWEALRSSLPKMPLHWTGSTRHDPRSRAASK